MAPSIRKRSKRLPIGRRRGNPGINNRSIRKLFLVITEGRNEYHYINSLKAMIGPTVELLCFSESDNKLSLMKKACQRRNDMAKRGEYDKETDETWVLFDRDADPQNKTETDLFNRAISLGESENIGQAYSNDAFELWLLLHFIYLDSSHTRDQLKQKLKTHLGGSYSKNNPGIYEQIVDHGGDRSKAIGHAQTLLLRQKELGLSPANANPSTTVHLLIMRLEKLVRGQ